MNWIRKILGLKTEKQCAIHNVSKRYKITYCKDGYLPKEFDIYIEAKTTKEACEKFFSSVEPIYHDILRINVC